MRVLMASLVLAVASVAFAAPASAAPVIPPGREALLADLLGKGGPDLPGPCQFVSASIESDRVVASYTCGPVRDAVSVVLLHPSAAGPGAVRAGAFSLSAPGAPPSLVEALAGRLAQREREWTWASSTSAATNSVPVATTTDRVLLVEAFALLVLVPFALALAVWTLDGRSRLLLVAVAAAAMVLRALAPHRLVMVYFGYEHVGGRRSTSNCLDTDPGRWSHGGRSFG